MKAKLLLLSGILFCSTAVWSQGIYSTEESNGGETVTTVGGTYSDGGSLRGLPGGTDPPAPIGEGILALSLLAGAYTIASRKRNKKA